MCTVMTRITVPNLMIFFGLNILMEDFMISLDYPFLTNEDGKIYGLRAAQSKTKSEYKFIYLHM